MPAIDHTGQYHVRAVATAKGSTAAIGFPIKASRVSTARRFADKMILELLPGWTRGRVTLVKDGQRVLAWVLSRSAAGGES